MQVGRDRQLRPDARAAADEGGLAVGNAGHLLVVMRRVGEVVRRNTRGRQVVSHGGAVAHLDAVVVVVLGAALARLDVGPAIFRTLPWGVEEEEASKLMLHCSPRAERYLPTLAKLNLIPVVLNDGYNTIMSCIPISPRSLTPPPPPSSRLAAARGGSGNAPRKVGQGPLRPGLLEAGQYRQPKMTISAICSVGISEYAHLLII